MLGALAGVQSIGFGVGPLFFNVLFSYLLAHSEEEGVLPSGSDQGQPGQQEPSWAHHLGIAKFCALQSRNSERSVSFQILSWLTRLLARFLCTALSVAKLLQLHLATGLQVSRCRQRIVSEWLSCRPQYVCCWHAQSRTHEKFLDCTGWGRCALTTWLFFRRMQC